jgi:hypothetical protein
MQCDFSCGYKVISIFFEILNHGRNLQKIQEKFKNYNYNYLYIYIYIFFFKYFFPLYTINNNIKHT